MTAPSRISVRQISAAEILSARELIDEYASESGVDGMPPAIANAEMYMNLEKAGSLHTIGAFLNDAAIGFITVLLSVIPHYSTLLAITESFFVAKAHRNTGAGLKLLRAAEDCAKEHKSPGLLVTAPFEGDLFRVLPRLGYRETNRVFFRKLAHV